jgi:hypothetical protein
MLMEDDSFSTASSRIARCVEAAEGPRYKAFFFELQDMAVAFHPVRYGPE